MILRASTAFGSSPARTGCLTRSSPGSSRRTRAAASSTTSASTAVTSCSTTPGGRLRRRGRYSGGAGEPDRRVDVATVPFALGRSIPSGPYEIRVTMADSQTVVVSVSTNDASAARYRAARLPGRQRTAALGGDGYPREPGRCAKRGTVSLRGSQAWRTVRSIAVPARAAASERLPVPVVPVRWGETVAVNIPDAKQGEIASHANAKPRDALTRVWQVRSDRSDQGTAKVTLDLVSIDGPHAFDVDLAVALLGESGELISCGHIATSLKVVSDPVEQRFEFDLGKPRGNTEPKFLAIGVAPGDILSAPMGSMWASFMPHRSPLRDFCAAGRAGRKLLAARPHRTTGPGRNRARYPGGVPGRRSPRTPNRRRAGLSPDAVETTRRCTRSNPSSDRCSRPEGRRRAAARLLGGERCGRHPRTVGR